MIKVHRAYRPFSASSFVGWLKAPKFYRIGMGFVLYLPFCVITIGHHTPPCRACGERVNVIIWDGNNPGAAICPSCCEKEGHPDIEWDRDVSAMCCIQCGDVDPEATYEHWYED